MNLTEVRTRDLISQCLRTREQDVWTEFVRRLQPLIAGVAVKVSRRCGNTDPQVIDDLIQEVFLKLCNDSHRVLRTCNIEDEVSFFGYIKVITANLVYDHFKYATAGKRNYQIETVLDFDPILEMRIPSSESIGLDIDRVLREENVPARDQSIFWLYFHQGFSAKEIAQSVGSGLSVKGVESCIYRLISLLRERFAVSASKGEGR